MNSILSRLSTILALTAILAMGAPSSAAAKKSSKNKSGGSSVSGKVVNKKGKGVSGAKVHIAHHSKKHQSHSKKTKTTAAAKPKTATKKHHHGVTSGAGGKFTLAKVHAGSHMVVAHLKHAGSGHAKVTVSSGKTAHV